MGSKLDMRSGKWVQETSPGWTIYVKKKVWFGNLVKQQTFMIFIVEYFFLKEFSKSQIFFKETILLKKIDAF